MAVIVRNNLALLLDLIAKCVRMKQIHQTIATADKIGLKPVTVQSGKSSHFGLNVTPKRWIFESTSNHLRLSMLVEYRIVDQIEPSGFV